MSDEVRRVYWDTGLFICFLNAKEKHRREICEDILKHARDGRIAIYTSMWTIAEVIKPKGSPAPLSEAEAKKIGGMFKWPWLHKVQVHEGVAFRAAELSRLYGLKPADAIHAATALMLGVDAMQVWDRDFSKIAKLINIEQPAMLTAQMPLLDVAAAIGPTPEDFVAAASQPSTFVPVVSTEQSPPASQSLDVGTPTETLPAQAPRAIHLGGLVPPPPDSSPDAAPPPPLKK